MKHIFKRIAALSAASLISVSALTACAEEVMLLDFIDQTGGSATFGGFELQLLQLQEVDTGSGDLSEGNLFGYPATTTLSDAAYKRISDVEAAYDCKINISYEDIEQEDLILRYMGNNIKYDAMYSADHDGALEAADSGILLPLEDYMDYANLLNTEKYGAVNVQEIVSFHGSIYGLCPVSWPYKQPRTIGLMVYNMDPISQYGKLNPKEFLENGTWNWDALEAIIKDYYVLEGEKEIHSLAARNFDFARLLAQSNGVELAQLDSNGELVLNYGSEAQIEALQWYKDVVSENIDAFEGNFFSSNALSWTNVADAICEGTSMCGITAPDILYYDIIYRAKNIAVTPFPCGPRGDYGEWTGIIEGQECFAVFKNTDEPEIVISIIDKICEPLEGFETYESLVDFIGNSVLYSVEDAEIVLNLHDFARYSYWSEEHSININDLYRDASSMLDEKTPAQIIGEYQTKIPQYLEDYIIPNLPIYDIIK
ncbi:MAG: hypothetical protein IJE51_02875 [Clostridia bacterium]|nr:hypothetical protein [Clostridia bacterium]